MEKVRGVSFDEVSLSKILDEMYYSAFNARRLAIAAKIFRKMVEEDYFVFLTLSGAMIPAGMRNVISGMMKNGFINCLVTTGANIVHELVEALGIGHEIGREDVDDVELASKNINRIYDVFVVQNAFEEVENFISPIISDLEGAYSTPEFLRVVGEKIEDRNSFLRVAYEKGIPVFSPTLHDSIVGLHLSIYRKKGFYIDFMKDINQILDLCFQKRKIGVVIVGGGVPKNFTLQAMLLADGFDSAIQITTDSPQWGGLSGATLSEAKSWCKLKENAEEVTVYCDATIALPLLYAYLLEHE
ncbi:deoxyhypusine synthase [Archaeoglobus sulfaticallidus PM70-1]|uniref:Deoxyhypusine synthase n=1 Tax=Archaeoglobus sulfaticallidus PM70-1 TaxID=387631 RepID=N0BG48_9EURY|nr:deoxyhypusine synthase [Archaeoglobus sulfaticallidus]AGK61978.1 deoxyhypusine synthase [Archaeoglobus sulfaticallidus PM70-1]